MYAVSPSPEPTAPAEDLESAGDPAETTWTADAILARARAVAVSLDPDPRRGGIYSGMPRSRWQQAAGLGVELLAHHAVYRGRHTRGRGRRQHAAAMHTLLDEANVPNLVAALAMLLVVDDILETSTR